MYPLDNLWNTYKHTPSNKQIYAIYLAFYPNFGANPLPPSTMHKNGLVPVISWYTGENWELKRNLPRNIPRFWLNQNLFLSVVFVTKKFEKFDLMWRLFFKKILKINFLLTFLPDLLISNGSGELILELSQTKPFLSF